MPPTDTSRADDPVPAATDRADADGSDEAPAASLVAGASPPGGPRSRRGPCADAAALLRLLHLLFSVLTTLATLAVLLR